MNLATQSSAPWSQERTKCLCMKRLTDECKKVGGVNKLCMCWGLTSQSTIFQSCRDGATASWVINQYFRGVKCLAQGHNTAAVGFEPPTSRSGVRMSSCFPLEKEYFPSNFHPPWILFLCKTIIYTFLIPSYLISPQIELKSTLPVYFRVEFPAFFVYNVNCWLS